MKSICLSLAAAATIGLVIAAPLSNAVAKTQGGARAPAVTPVAPPRAPAVAPFAPPRVVVPNIGVQLPPYPAKPASVQDRAADPLPPEEPIILGPEPYK